MQAYANDVVAAVMDACSLKGVPHPCITSESGRALASHQSVLVFNVRNATVFESLAQQHLLRTSMAQEPEQEQGKAQGQEQGQTQGQGGVQKQEGSIPQAVGQTFPRGRPGTSAESMEKKGSEDGALAGASSPQAVGQYFLGTFREVYDAMDGSNFQEAYNDAKQFKKEAASLFKLGCLSLTQRAQVDALFLVSIC